MTNPVGAAYDEVAELYTKLFLDGLQRVDADRLSLDAFAELVVPALGVVADLGCGPGLVVDYLASRGVDAVGFDASTEMIEQARSVFPESAFHVGDFTALDVEDGSFGGLVSRYSIIHLDKRELPNVFREWARVLAPGSPALVSFCTTATAAEHGALWDHKVIAASLWHAPTVVSALEAAGFEHVETRTRGPLANERNAHHATIIAKRR